MVNTMEPTRKKRRGNNKHTPFEERGVTEAQIQYIKTHYGERPLVLLAQECDLDPKNAHLVRDRLKKAGELGEGPGHDWRGTMKAHGYVPGNRPIVSIAGILKPRAEATVGFGGDPSCVHHRICIQIGEGREEQRCKLCGDVKIVRLW